MVGNIVYALTWLPPPLPHNICCYGGVVGIQQLELFKMTIDMDYGCKMVVLTYRIGCDSVLA